LPSIKHPAGRIIAIEIKPTQRYVVYAGEETFPMKNETYAISLLELLKDITR